MDKGEKLCLRNDIQLMPIQNDGQQMFLVVDPLELYDKGTVALRAETLNILALLDGTRTAEDVRMSLVEQSARAGMLTSIPLEMVESFVRKLDESYLLDNERFRKAREWLVESFRKLSERPAALAGNAYPSDPQALADLLDRILESGPDQAENFSPGSREIVGLVSPHIELRTGQRLYGAAYRTLKGASYDRVVVLGVGHHLDRGLFSFTDKDFATPQGTIPADRDAAAELRRAAGGLAAPDDFEHRREHSIELQAIFLRHVLEGPFSIVPVLCGNLHRHLILDRARRPRQIPGLAPALDVLSQLLADPERKTLLVAGVDFSHVGPKFGDKAPAVRITDYSTVHDKALLKALTETDVEAFCEESRRVSDRFHVCGQAALAIMLEVLPKGIVGLELGHEVWHEARTKSAVSFAAAVFFKQ